MTVRCDTAMRRSKEQCYLENGERWKCTGDCENCICALFKQDDGTWIHKRLYLGHNYGGQK